MFRKLFNRAASTFDQVDYMVTRKLPIPDLEGTDKHVQFIAKRTKTGQWTISSKHNLRTVTAGLQKVSHTYQAACEKHAGRKSYGEVLEMNFDTAFLILKDMEESLLHYRASPLTEEPKHHYMSAYRLLPEKMREGLDDLFSSRTEKKGLILPPKTLSEPVAQPGVKPGSSKPGLPRPN